MVYEGKTVTLKDGRILCLRAVEEKDAAQLIAYMKKTKGESEFLSSYPEEFKYTEEMEKDYITSSLAGTNECMIIAEVDGRIVGNSMIQFPSSIKTRHRSTVAIAIFKEYYRLGIGSAMFEELIRLAKENGRESIELEMIEGNVSGFALYSKFGFKEVARIPKAYRFKDGTYHDSIFMMKEL